MARKDTKGVEALRVQRRGGRWGGDGVGGGVAAEGDGLVG